MKDYKEQFIKYFKDNEENIIQEIKELISIDSVLVDNPANELAPFGEGNVEALKYFLNKGKEKGFETYNCENVAGHIEYGEGEEVFAVLCHTDVVPAIGNWTKPPFESYVKDGKIYGRGSIDDKGPAVVSLYALKALKDMDIKLNKKVRLIVGTDEESGSRGVKRYIKKLGMPQMGISPDADFPIIYGEKGMMTLDLVSEGSKEISVKGGARYNIVAPSLECNLTSKSEDYKKALESLKEASINGDFVTVEGVSAHAMEPDNGKNAIVIFSKAVKDVTSNNVLKFIGDKLVNSRLKDMNLDYHTDEMGDMTMNVGLIEINEEKSSVGLNIRYPKGFDYDLFINEFSKSCEEYGLKVIVKSHSKPHYVDPNSDFIKTLHASYIKYTGDTESKLKTIGGGTYARELEMGVAYGVLFPGEVEMAHQTDEFAVVENLLKAGAIIADAIYNICK